MNHRVTQEDIVQAIADWITRKYVLLGKREVRVSLATENGRLYGDVEIGEPEHKPELVDASGGEPV